MQILEFEAKLKQLYHLVEEKSIGLSGARSILRELDEVRRTAETPARRHIMTLFLQSYRKDILNVLWQPRRIVCHDIEPMTILNNRG